MHSLIQSNPEVTRQYVEEAILPIQDMLEGMDDKLNALLPKQKRDRNTLPLRDPVYTELFEVFLNAAGSTSKYNQDLKCAQLKIAYTVLFHVGLRVNEIGFFQQKNIQDAIKTSQFRVIHFKQNESHIHVISDLAVQDLRELKHYYDIVFVKYKYLFGKNKPVDEKYLIKMINKDLKHTCEINQIPYNIKSHSLRINMITRLLKNTSVQNTADIVGHRDIKSTMVYKRYALNKKEIHKLLNKIDLQN
jgi:integrase